MSEPITTTNELAVAWREWLRLTREAEKVQARADTIFSVHEVALRRPDQYSRALLLVKIATQMRKHATVEFTKALKRTFGKRYTLRIKGERATVHAHHAYEKTRYRLDFTRNTRPIPLALKQHIENYRQAMQHVKSL